MRLSPTMKMAVPRIGEYDQPTIQKVGLEHRLSLELTATFNLTTGPAAVCHWLEAILPYGIQVGARLGQTISCSP